MASIPSRPPLVLGLLLLLAAGKPPLEWTDVQADLPQIAARLAVSGPGVPREVEHAVAALALTLGADDTFRIVLDDGRELSGSAQRHGPAGRSLRLQLDAAGEDALRASIVERVAGLLVPGLSAGESTAELRRVRLRLRLDPDASSGSAVARLSARVSADVGLDLGPDDVPLRVRWRLSGPSETFPLDTAADG